MTKLLFQRSIRSGGRPRTMDREISQQITIAACNHANGPYNLSKKFKITHGHISKCRTGEEGLSKVLALKLVYWMKTDGIAINPTWKNL